MLRWSILFALTAPGCAEIAVADGGHHHEALELHEEAHHAAPSAAAARILIMESKNIGRATEVLGLVDVHAPVHTHDEAFTELREHAAELGADAVIGVEFDHGDGGTLHVSGMAVRYRDLIGGRSYERVGDLDVSAPMGHEDDANRELGRRARNLGADLIINIEFHHGEADGVRLTGTAIRFSRPG